MKLPLANRYKADLIADRDRVHDGGRIVSIGTTSLRLLESGQAPLAIGYATASVLGGLLATWAGLTLTKL